MRDADIGEFSKLLLDVATLLGRPEPSAGQIALFFRAMSHHSIQAVRNSLDDHLRDPKHGRYFPTPADLIGKIEGRAADDGRPGAEEAWSIAIKAADEYETVVWTAEITEAWGAAKNVWDTGDRVGARMAFKEAYERCVTQARKQGEMVRWSCSMGFDKEKRAIAMAKAADQGRLLGSEAIQLAHDVAKPLMIESNENIPADTRERIKDLLARLRMPKEEIKQSELDVTKALKAEQDRKLKEYLEKGK